MMNSQNIVSYVLGFCVLLMLTTGCASVAPYAEDSSSTPSTREAESKARGQDVATRKAPSERSGEVRAPIAREAEDFSGEIEAVRFILDQAEQSLNVEDYRKALSLTERALRIQAKAPRAYLIAAQSYRQQGEAEQARNIAKQGLLYASPRTTLHHSLRKIVSRKGRY